MITHYIMEESIFDAIICKLSVQKKYYNVMLKTALKLILEKGLRCLRKVNMLDLKISKEKKN